MTYRNRSWNRAVSGGGTCNEKEVYTDSLVTVELERAGLVLGGGAQLKGDRILRVGRMCFRP